jgi:predicted nucleotide-binding protein (sugar kinase/HSP70/actin superfamily)
MLVSLPNMGNSWPAFKAIFNALGFDVVLPDPTNREAVKIGVKNSPEFVCFPFKTTIGDFVNAIQKGADTLVMVVDCGPCRLGFYSAVQERIIHDMGYKDVKVIPLNQADLLDFSWFKLFVKMTGIKNPISYWKAVKAAKYFVKKAKYIEDIERCEGKIRAYEVHGGDTSRVVQDLLVKLDEANTDHQLRSFRQVIAEGFRTIKVDPTRRPLRVAISGEIHVTLESYVNLDIRRRLGELGCEVHQNLSLFDWIAHKFHLNYHRKWLEHLAHPYMPIDIGGEAVWVIGEYIDRAKKGFDGFVHTYPFTCMPEIAARTIISNHLQKQLDLPIIFFSLDEQAGSEGFRTRCEAFCDLMRGRRSGKDQKVLSNGVVMESKRISDPYLNGGIQTEADLRAAIELIIQLKK